MKRPIEQARFNPTSFLNPQVPAQVQINLQQLNKSMQINFSFRVVSAVLKKFYKRNKKSPTNIERKLWLLRIAT